MRQRSLALFLLLTSLLWVACEGDGGGSGLAGDDVHSDGSGGADVATGVDAPVGSDVPADPDVSVATDVPAGTDVADDPDVAVSVGPTVRFDLAGDDFYDSPFPSALRVTPSGAPDWTLMPKSGALPVVRTQLLPEMKEPFRIH